MSTGGFTISIVCSPQFVTVNQHNKLDEICYKKNVLAINDVALYRDLTVSKFYEFSTFLLFTVAT
jgi:hypothetical protein